MNFGEVLSRAWNIIWKNKILWIFGLLAALGGGSASSNFNYRFEGNNLPAPFRGMLQTGNFPAWLVLLLVGAALVLFVVIVILSTLGRAGLVRGIWLADAGEGRLSFTSLFEASRVYFLRVLLLGLLIFGISLSLILAIVIPGAIASVFTFGIAMICLLPLICLLVPVFIVLQVVFDLAIISIVGEDLSVMDGLRRGWEVFRAHLGEMIGMGVIIVIGTAVANFIIGLPTLPILAMVAGATLSGTRVLVSGGILLALVLFLLYLPVLLVLHGIVTAYVESAWTLTFRRLTGRGEGTTSAASPENL